MGNFCLKKKWNQTLEFNLIVNLLYNNLLRCFNVKFTNPDTSIYLLQSQPV